MLALRTAALLLALLAGGAAAAARSLQADAGPTPPECSGIFTESWSSDHIECHFKVCDGNPQLKCSHHGGIIRSESVSCELDASIFSAAITWDCPVQSQQVMCDWAMVQSKVPGCAWEPTRRILGTWKAS
ncbi:hypothetical protein ABPG75_006801 [Micractinium tetrahymenae]